MNPNFRMTGGRESLQLEVSWKSRWTGNTAGKDLNCRQCREWTDEDNRKKERERSKGKDKEEGREKRTVKEEWTGLID